MTIQKKAKFLVGGAIRDKLLGEEVKERDWCLVGFHPDELIKLGYIKIGKYFPVFLHPETYEEYALARIEKKNEKQKGHTAFTCFSNMRISIIEDLFRRDITINAIAEDKYGNFIDPYNGIQDIKNRIIRHVSPAFIEDPLRVLRVARFYAKLSNWNFQISSETLSLMQNIVSSGELQTISKERIWCETYKSLQSSSPYLFFYTLHKIGALEIIFDHKEFSLDILFYAQKITKDPKILFCVIFSTLNTQNIKAPKSYIDLLILCQKYSKTVIYNNIKMPEDYLNILMKVDAIRKKNRFYSWLIYCDILAKYHKKYFSIQFWKDLNFSIKNIRSIIDINFFKNKKNLSKIIYNARLKLINYYLKNKR